MNDQQETVSGRRTFNLALLLRLPSYAWCFAQCVVLFRNPISFVYHYITGSAPAGRKVVLRSGLEIHLSDHPHDIRTVFVVFIKKDYGRVSPGAVVLDFGSNIGVFALYAAHAGARKIYSFEPNQRNYDALVRNVEANGLKNVIVPFKRAVSPVAHQTVKFALASGPYNQILEDEKSSNDYELVDTTSIEAILSDHALGSVDLLKADCEGAEYDILMRASASLLSRIRAIRIEFHRWPMEELILHLKRQGFACVHLDRENAVAWFEREGAR